jgi:hypothetical protein
LPFRIVLAFSPLRTDEDDPVDRPRRSTIGCLEHVPAKLNDFADKNMLQLIDLARFLFARVIPPERKAR